MLNQNGFISLLRKIWNYIKHIFRKIINFFKDIVSFFKDPDRMRKRQENDNYIAVAIKDHLDNGDYNVVNCLFDTNSNNVVDLDLCAEGIEAEELDEQTSSNFGNKEMIILN